VSTRRIEIEAPSEMTVLAARHLDETEGPVRVGSMVDHSTRSAISQVLRYISRAHNAPDAGQRGPAAFLTRVLELFSLSHADAYGDLFWRVDDGEVKVFANVSDVFFWGGSDVEQITPQTLPELEGAYADLAAVGGGSFLAELYAARRRKMRPQGAAYPGEADEAGPAVAALYNACGPERAIDVGNPQKQPVY
jgi:hypothetical protein